MKRFVVVLVLAELVGVSRAIADEYLDTQLRDIKVAGYDATEQVGLVKDMTARTDALRRDLDALKEDVRAIAPDMISEISNLPDAQQLGIIRGFLAEKSFEYYRQKYIAEFKAKSAATGRKILKETFDGDGWQEIIYHLDGGDVLESKKCQYDPEKRQACDYPDGFEEYILSFQNYFVSGNPKPVVRDLSVFKDDAKTNDHQEIEISLQIENVHVPESDNAYAGYWGITVDVVGATETYADHHRWRNQEAADIRAGMWRKTTRSERRQAKRTGAGGVSKYAIDDRTKWKSMRMPDAVVSSLLVDETVDYSYKHYDEAE